MVCYSAEETPKYLYFPTSGMISVISSSMNGKAAEVGIIGHEGLVGSLHLLGSGCVSTSAFVQLEGVALRIPFRDIQKVYWSSEEIRARILEFAQEQAVSTSQIAGCNRLHNGRERLARCLLMAQARTGSNVLKFTQEILGMMVGVRRTTVSLLAGDLQKAGAIDYRRGNVVILDQPALQAAACDCYRVTSRLLAGLYSRPLPGVRPFVPEGLATVKSNGTISQL